MEWWVALLVIFGAFVLLLLTGLPVAFCFLSLNVIGVFVFWGGEAGLRQLILSIAESVTRFDLLPLPLFILMGDIMFYSGVGGRMMDALDSWLGRIPGRLSLLAVAGGTLFATLSGAAVAGVAMLGSVLVPHMENRGYKKTMSLGPIMACGSLAIMIPPTSLGVLLAALGQFSVGDFLVAIIIPGLIMATFYAAYIIVRCQLQPSLAPPFDVAPIPLSRKLNLTLRYVLPLGTIIFLVIGLIFLGVATPTEAAALGTVGCFVLAYLYRGLNKESVWKSMGNTIQATGMIFLILSGATAFSQLLAFTGASRGLVALATNLNVTPIMILIAMQIILLFLGCFMDPGSIMMITIPIFMPIVNTLHMNPIWFGVIVLLNMEMATRTPPFGLCLFVMKSVAPQDTTMADVYKASMPFISIDLLVMMLLMAFPVLTLWLPSLIR